MKRLGASAVLVALLGYCGFASAGTIGVDHIDVACDTTIKVTDDMNGKTLTLDKADPIRSTVCPKDGITIKNSGKGAVDRTFTLDCQTSPGSPITGSGKNTGIELSGPNLTVQNCHLSNFKIGITVKGDDTIVDNNRVVRSTGNAITATGDRASITRNRVVAAGGDGITAKGDGIAITGNRVENSAGDGFAVKDSVGARDEDLGGITISDNLAFGNGGWGFSLLGNGISVASDSAFFGNVADGNAAGGFFVKGEGNNLSSLQAVHNGGPGILVTGSTSCCASSLGAGQALTGALAAFNTGPGIIYSAKNDGTNCGPDDPGCAGGVFFPIGFDAEPGAMIAVGNGGTCPKKSSLFADGICVIINGSQCKESALEKC